ncbi:MAG TPA: zinc-binding dehydrogenase [Candidatus Acidoferrales bacterium]|nr:zinc-binding dehydrogenase [Candidatus Acidoferrales bacterium]
MRAVAFDRTGGPEVLEERTLPDPAPGPGEVLVRVRACGINHLDLWVRAGLPGLEPVLPHVLGSDVAGEIEALGAGVSGLAIGQRTLVNPTLSCGQCAACRRGDDHLCRQYDVIGRRSQGGYAERVVVPAANCLAFPERLSFEQAAAVPLVFLTAWHMLVTRAGLASGEDVLVIGAGSGVGSAAVQIARRRGARVIATVGDPARFERARALGALEVIDHAHEDVAARVRALTQRKGVEVVFEHVGGRIFEAGVAALARDGRLVTCGATIGGRVTLDVNVLFGRHLTLMGSWMGRRSDMIAVLAEIASGALEPVLDRVMPLAEARAAHERIEARQQFGKVVLVP